MRRESDLFRHQRAIVQRMMDRDQNAILVAPGYGKTAAALTGLYYRDAWPALVVAPARVARKVWPAETAEWSHLRHLQVTSIHGSPAQRSKRLTWDNHVECVSYENLLWLSDEVELSSRYRAIIFDELSKMKAPGTKRFRRMRARAMGIPIRVGLTGTPVPNHLLDLWGEMFMVGGKDVLGPTFSGYRARYFEAQDYFQREWAIRSPVAEKEIHRRVAPWSYVLPETQEVKVPALHTNVVSVDLPEKVQEMQRELEKELFTTLDSGVEIEALSASTVAMKLRQFASGAVYLNPNEPEWEEVHDEKITALVDLVDELQGEPLLVFYWFKHERDRILAALPQAQELTNKNLDSWNRREIEVLVAHPQSAGHGLNLQHGGSTVAWFTLPFSHELWLQGNGRLARTGQKKPIVMAHVFTCGAVDERVLSILTKKGATERRLLDTLLGA